MEQADIIGLLQSRRRGHSLPARFYNDADVYALDLAAIFHRRWICIGAACEISQPGEYVTARIGDASVLVLRDNDGEVRGFHNTCRHRGARICDAQHGRARALVCPYHRWTYNLSGQLTYASWMGENFDKSGISLKPVHVRVIAGTIYVCLAEDPPDIGDFALSMERMLAPHRLTEARLACSVDMIAAANWKLVMENSRECYHCATGHRELMRTFLDLYDLNDPEIAAFWDRCEQIGLPSRTAEGPDWRANRLPFTHGAKSITPDGKLAVERRLGTVPEADTGSLRWVHYPSAFNHALADYAVIVRMLPIAPQRTLVTTKFLVSRDAVEGKDYDLERLTHVWNVTNEQDKALVERNQDGVNSLGYEPGPYSPIVEAGVIKFVDWYCAQLERHIGARPAAAAPRDAAFA